MKKTYIIIAIIVGLAAIGISIYFIFSKKEKVVEENVTQEVVDKVKIIIGEKELIVNLENNSTANKLVEKLEEGNITIEATEYGGFEKVGDLGFKLPRADKYTQTKVGDVLLYNGNQIVIFYGTNTWNYTRIGKIDISQEELKDILGDGDITYTITK